MRQINFVIGLLLVFVTSGCVKEKTVPGCTNKDATNYNPEATSDDGSCIVIPFQGPRNGSFETVSDWKVIQGNGMSYFTYETGTGFMPTKGTYFGRMSCESTNNFYSTDLTIFQDNVDFSNSDSLIFDYSYDTQTGVGMGGKVAAEMFFTSNGTDTIWRKSHTGVNFFKDERKNLAVALPANVKTVGRLTIKVTVEAAGLFFELDNIRVK